jgi:hypothetical protein
MIHMAQQYAEQKCWRLEAAYRGPVKGSFQRRMEKCSMLTSVSLTSCSGHRARKKNIRNTRHPILCGFHSSTVLTVSAQSINFTCMMPRSKSDVSAVPNAFANHSSSCFLKKEHDYFLPLCSSNFTKIESATLF